MSDNQTWQVPGSPPPPPYSGGTEAPPPPSPRPSPHGPPPTSPLAPHGWTPPPKPGLIPLRPMTLGTILGASFQVMRRNPRSTIGPALLLSALLTIVSALGATAYVGALTRIPTAATSSDAEALAAGSLLVSLLILIGGGAATAIATAVLQAIVVTEVARGTVGEKLRFSQLWAAARGRLGAVIGYTLLLILVAGVGIALVFGLVVLITVATASGTSGSSNIAAGIFAVFGVMLLGFLGAGALYLWLSTRLAFVPAAIVLERLPIRVAIGRSWTLTRGYFWRTLGIQLLVIVMISFASSIVTFPISLVFSLGGALLFPTGGDASSAAVVAVVSLIAVSAVTAVVTAIGLVLQSSTASLLYLDLRMRKEGLDLELSRFVEARQTGASVPDPYLPHGTAQTSQAPAV